MKISSRWVAGALGLLLMTACSSQPEHRGNTPGEVRQADTPSAPSTPVQGPAVGAQPTAPVVSDPWHPAAPLEKASIRSLQDAPLRDVRGPIRSVVTGPYHHCLIDDLGVVCPLAWGDSVDQIPRFKKPVALLQPMRWTRYVCALDQLSDQETEVVCWGLGSIRLKARGLKVAGQGQYHVCVSDQDGVRCKGQFNRYGQLNPPPTLTHPTQFALDDDFSCALQDGRLICWGRDSLRIPDAQFSEVALGSGRICGVTLDAGVRCFDYAGSELWQDQLAKFAGKKNSALKILREGAVCFVSDGALACVGDASLPEVQTAPQGTSGIDEIMRDNWRGICALSQGRAVACWLRDESKRTWDQLYYSLSSKPSVIFPYEFATSGCVRTESELVCVGTENGTRVTRSPLSSGAELIRSSTGTYRYCVRSKDEGRSVSCDSALPLPDVGLSSASSAFMHLHHICWVNDRKASCLTPGQAKDTYQVVTLPWSRAENVWSDHDRICTLHAGEKSCCSIYAGQADCRRTPSVFSKITGEFEDPREYLFESHGEQSLIVVSKQGNVAVATEGGLEINPDYIGNGITRIRGGRQFGCASGAQGLRCWRSHYLGDGKWTIKAIAAPGLLREPLDFIVDLGREKVCGIDALGMICEKYNRETDSWKLGDVLGSAGE